MTERDPRSDPQLGDVWRFIGEGYPFTMFLCRKPEGDGKGWWGLDLYPGEGGYLETPRVTDFGDMPDEDWKFVEHIEPYATGGVLPATELGGLTYKAAMELTVADFDKIKVSLRKLSTPELAAAFVKIKDAGS